MNIFITGGCGFIGTNFINYWRSLFPESTIINLDKLTYAANKINFDKKDNKSNYKFIKGDISDKDLVSNILYKYYPTYVINFAAESHVDRSIIYPEEFINTNILGTFRLLTSVNNYYSKMNIEEKTKFRFLHISTDEVYGSLSKDQDPFRETNKYFPNSPYSASKASSDHIVRSFHKTYNLPTLISNCSNNYGPYQSLEKFIPLVIHNALMQKEIPIYGDGMNVRDWLYVNDHCDAIKTIILNGDPGEVYNIGCSNEIRNIDIAKTICTLLDSLIPLNGKKSYIDFIKFINDRPGHDFRYAIDSSKIKKKLSWHAKTSFNDGIISTINWYLENMSWFKKNAGKDFDEWIDLQY